MSYPASQDDRVEGGSVIMAWLVLIISGLLESVWAVALSRSAGFTRPLPSVISLGEPATGWRVLSLLLILAGVVGLKLSH